MIYIGIFLVGMAFYSALQWGTIGWRMYRIWRLRKRIVSRRDDIDWRFRA